MVSGTLRRFSYRPPAIFTPPAAKIEVLVLFPLGCLVRCVGGDFAGGVYAVVL